MYNCHKLFINGRLFGIFHTLSKAEFVLQLLDEGGMVYEHEIKPAFVDNIGF